MKPRKGVSVTVVTSEHKDRRGKPRLTLAETDIAKFNAQYPSLMVRYGEKFHDRFRILDDEEIVRDRQKAYYRAISVADRTGDACEFIEFMLVALRDALVTVKKSVGKGVVKSVVKILDLVAHYPEITRERLAQEVGLSVRGVEKNLAQLKADGRLRRIGGRKGGRWEVVK